MINKTRTLVEIGMLGAIATVLMLFEFPLPFIAPPFYEIDLSEVPVLVGAFALGPVAGATIEFVKILINLLINGTATAFVGEIGNYIIGCSFIIPAALIYKKKKSKKKCPDRHGHWHHYHGGFWLFLKRLCTASNLRCSVWYAN